MAFMAQDGWKSGLTAVQLSKVEALQTDCERLQKEAAQRKLMVENQEQELERQKRKVSDLRLPYTNLTALCGLMSTLAVDYFLSRKFHTVSFFTLDFVAP